MNTVQENTEIFRKLHDHNHFTGVRIVTWEQWNNRGEKSMNISDIQKYRGQDLSHRYSLTDEEYKFLEEHFEKLELLWKYKRALEEADEEKEEKFKYINICFELRKAFEDAKKERDCRVAEYQKKIDDLERDLKTAGEKIQDLVGENMKLQCERNDYKTKSEFLEIERMRVKKNEVADFLPTEPIKVADMLINAEGEYKHNPLEKAFCGTDKGTYCIFGVSELRQIAEHLLVYCNHSGEAEE